MANADPHVSDLPVGQQGCCEAGFTEKTFMSKTQSCVICRDDGDKTKLDVIFKAGHVYKKCSPVVADPSPDALPCVVVPMTSPTEEICGVLDRCDIDLTAEGAEDCPGSVLRCALFDINRMCWPESFTVEDLQAIAWAHKDKPCFATRLGCPIMPAYYQTPEKEAVK